MKNIVERYDKLMENQNKLRKDVILSMTEMCEKADGNTIEFKAFYVDSRMPSGDRMAINAVKLGDSGLLFIQDISGYKFLPNFLKLHDLIKTYKLLQDGQGESNNTEG